MEINKISKSEIFHIETDDEDYPNYIRYSATCWMKTMGESDEPVYDCLELEALFQEKKNAEN